jgi:hypothetical protein
MNLVTMPPELVELDEIEKMLKSGNDRTNAAD